MAALKRKRQLAGLDEPDGDTELPIAPAPSLNVDEKRAIPADSVFRIEVTRNVNDYSRPWQPSSQTRASGSGFAIKYIGPNKKEHRGVITNAHVVHEFTIIYVVKHGTTRKFKASLTPEFSAIDLDLVMLTIDDQGFWTGIPTLSLSADLPELFSDVMVVGYPTGGRQICVTKGVVSRITSNAFSIDYFPGPKLMCMQIDAAINPGNSGGPTLFGSGNDLKVCGVATQKLSGQSYDNVGYLIPASTVLRFLKDIEEHGRFRGIVGKGFSWTPLENPALRRRHSLSEDTDEGVLITNIHTYNTSQTESSQLRIGDVLISIDGIKVASNGDVALPRAAAGLGGIFSQVNLTKLDVLFSMRRHGDSIELEVLRKKEANKPSKLVEPISVGTQVRFQHNMRWRWEKDMTHQADPRAGIIINRIVADSNAQSRRPCWLAPHSNTPIQGPTDVLEGRKNSTPQYTYTVLDELAGQVSDGVYLKDLLQHEPWHSGAYTRYKLNFKSILYAMPIMQSVRQHQPGATLSYLMVGGLIFINQVWAPVKKRSTRNIGIPPVTWRPRVKADDQQVYLSEIYQHVCNFGYMVSTHGGLLRTANGVHVRNLRQLKNLISNLTEGFLELTTVNGTIVLDVQECNKSQSELLRVCNMQSYCSADLLQ